MLQCSYCSKEFPTIGRLNEHVGIHINKRYICVKCGKNFSNEANLRRHVREKHPGRSEVGVNTLWSTDDRAYTCTICKIVYSNENYNEYLAHIDMHRNEGVEKTARK